jgi:hypothetical protein
MNKEQYFYRLTVFTRHDGKVSLVDKQNPREPVELDPWLGMVLALADGQHTIAELETYLASQYEDKTPESLLKTIDSVINRLIASDAVALSDSAVDLPYHLSRALEEQDPAIAKPLLEEAGYHQPPTEIADGITRH